MSAAMKSAQGDEMRKDYRRLQQQVIRMHKYWSLCNALFAASDDQIDLLNRASGEFFRIAERMLTESAVLATARLLDPPGEGKKENLSVPWFLEKYKSQLGDLKAADILNQLSNLREDLAPIRHKLLAHNDVLSLKGREAFGSGTVGDHVRTIYDTMEAIREEIAGPDGIYHKPDPEASVGVSRLLRLLQHAVDAEEEESGGLSDNVDDD